MSNEYFTQPPDLAAETKARSVDINTLAAAIMTAFDKVPGRTAIYTDNLNYGVDTGAADAIVVSVNSAVVALVDGQEVRVKVAHPNLTTTPTNNVNGLGAVIVTRNDGTAVAPGDIPAGIVAFSYNATTARWTIAPPGTQGVQGIPGPTGTKGADIASASTINLTTATGDFVHLTGTATVNTITLAVGVERTVVVDGVLTLTNSAGLLLPGGANIITAANDRFKVRGDTAGAIVVSYDKADGTAVKTGMVLLATLTPTAAANIDFLTTFTSSYDNYLVIASGITVSSDDVIRLRLANAGTTDTGSNYYSSSDATSTQFTTAATNHVVTKTITSAGKGVSFTIEIRNANDATNLKVIHCHGVGQTAATPGYSMYYVDGVYIAANAVSGIRLYTNSGLNFGATGKVRVYGYNNS